MSTCTVLSPHRGRVQQGAVSPIAPEAGDVKVQAKEANEKESLGGRERESKPQTQLYWEKNPTTTTTPARVFTCIPHGPPDTCKPELPRNHPCSREPDRTPQDNGTKSPPAAGHRSTLPHSTLSKQHPPTPEAFNDFPHPVALGHSPSAQDTHRQSQHLFPHTPRFPVK